MLTVVWLVVEPVLKIRLAALPTPLEPNWISPTTWRAEAGVMVLMPMLVPVSKIKELAVVEAPVALGR